MLLESLDDEITPIEILLYNEENYKRCVDRCYILEDSASTFSLFITYHCIYSLQIKEHWYTLPETIRSWKELDSIVKYICSLYE